MIAQIEGNLIRKSPDEVVIDVSGVGFSLIVSLPTFYKLPEDGRVLLHTYTHVREDALQLYGFWDQEEKKVFKLLIGVTKIGPKLARNILSGLSAKSLERAIGGNDLGAISAIPGVGRKTAERIVIELRDKVGAADQATGAKPSASSFENDAVSALINLGYKQADSQKIVKKILAENNGLTLEELIKDALRKLGR